MKSARFIVISAIFAVLCSSCVVRTVEEVPQQRGAKVDKASVFGAQHKNKQVGKKVIWIWQDEYKTGKK